MFEEKVTKAKDSLDRAIESYKKEKRMAKGDLDYARENVNEAMYVLLAELDEEEAGSLKKYEKAIREEEGVRR